MSEVYDLTDPDVRADAITAAAAAVRDGDIVVLPTDTVYGVGCDAFRADTVTRLLSAKGRGRDMPPPVLIPTPRTALGLATEIPDYAHALMTELWPGQVTLVLKAHSSLHWDLGDTNGTVALRVPDHPATIDLLNDVGPMAVTSANLTGSPPARTVEAAQEMLGEVVAVYLNDGPADEGPVSTIIDCTGEAPVVLRIGAISPERVDEIAASVTAKEPEDDATPTDSADDGSEPVDEPAAQEQSPEGSPEESPHQTDRIDSDDPPSVLVDSDDPPPDAADDPTRAPN